MFGFLRKKVVKKQGIWEYADFYAENIPSDSRLILKDGETGLVEKMDINHDLGIEHLFFKREDENESGSLKGRSLAYQVSLAKKRGEKNLVISTSGNAGIALSAYAKEAGIKAFVFISPETESGKIADMQKYNPVIIKSSRPIRLANYAAAKYKIKNLRPSVDEDSIEGFQSIAFEVSDEVGEVDAMFTFVTSGSSFVGIYRGFEKYFQLGKIKNIPHMYAVQSGEIVSAFTEGNIPSEKDQDSSAGRLGIKKTRRQTEILDIISKTGGSGIYVNSSEIESARDILFRNNLVTSWEGCANLAGFIKKQKENNFKKAVCILSGKFREDRPFSSAGIYEAEKFEDVDAIINNFIN